MKYIELPGDGTSSSISDPQQNGLDVSHGTRGHSFHPDLEIQARADQGLVKVKLGGHGSPFCVAAGRIFLSGIDPPFCRR